MKVKGISKRNGKYRLRKYNMHIGMYDTYAEAVQASKEEDEAQERFRYMQQYLKAKQWLQAEGILPKKECGCES